jgi:CHAT domain-containing protein
MKALQAASKMSMEKNGVALVLATHGLIPNAERGLFLPRLLSVENNKTVLISNSDIEAVYLPNSVIFLSACDTASGLTETPDLFFTGFVESFANSGSDLIMASLWPVHSMTSKKVTTSFFEAWKTKSVMDSIGVASKSVEQQKRFLPFVFILP